MPSGSPMHGRFLPVRFFIHDGMPLLDTSQLTHTEKTYVFGWLTGVRDHYREQGKQEALKEIADALSIPERTAPKEKPRWEDIDFGTDIG